MPAMSATDPAHSDVRLTAIGDALYRGASQPVVELASACLAQGTSAQDVLNRGLIAGMDRVGADFRDGNLFLPEVLLAAQAMKAGLAVLQPHLAAAGVTRIAKAVIGTVKGDIHDIGKNLVSIMWQGAGIEVVDLGVQTTAPKFITALDQHQPDILGMSALLTTTMPYMRTVLQELQKCGLRERCLVIVGGAPTTPAFAAEIGADAHCRNAAEAVATARRLLAERKPQ
jgi:5-methyltetrahydrofolate--homocysteine methyltransferase